MIQKIILLLCLIGLASNLVFSQDLEPPRQVKKQQQRNKLFFGGDFSLQFGSITDLEIGPLVGYRILPRLSVATGVKYEFYADSRFNPVIKTNIYGLRTFARYLIIPEIGKLIPLNINLGIYVHSEYEGLSLDREWFDNTSSSTVPGRFWLSSILVGGGLRQPIGPRSSINFSILYNLNETANSIYSNPLFRIGFIF